MPAPLSAFIMPQCFSSFPTAFFHGLFPSERCDCPQPLPQPPPSALFRRRLVGLTNVSVSSKQQLENCEKLEKKLKSAIESFGKNSLL